jgi:hypothetical protein
LDLFGVKEQTSNPLQVRMLNAVTDRVRALAEVNVREEGLSSFTGSTSSGEVVQLTEIADTGCLDDTTSPPATSFDVGTGGLSKDRCLSVRAAGT